MNVSFFSKYIFTVVIACVLGSSYRLNAQGITTIANVLTKQGYSGDGQSAAYASFNGPRGIAVDSAGNVYVADAINNRIRMIDLFGTVTTFAGNGKAGFKGDGGQAIDAEFNQPSYLIFDKDGNLYISDTHNLRVRKINKEGIITTIAGNGILGFKGDSSAATKAEIDFPYGLTFDKYGNLYIVTAIRVRKVDPDGIITTVVGSGQSGYGGDSGLASKASFGQLMSAAFDKNDNMYVCDKFYHTVRRIDHNTGIITRFAGTSYIIPYSTYTGDGGPANIAKMIAPTDIKFDKYWDLYITDQSDGRIRKIDTNGIITTFAGNGKNLHSGDGGSAIDAGIHAPYGLAIDKDDNIYFAETSVYKSEAANDIRFIFAADISFSNSPMELYPNPTFNGEFRMLFTSAYEENLDLQITNEAGFVVYRNSVPTNRPVYVRMEPTGMYFITGKAKHSKWRNKVSVVR